MTATGARDDSISPQTASKASRGKRRQAQSIMAPRNRESNESTATRSGAHFDELAERVRLRQRDAFVLETFEMELDGLADQPQDFLARFRRGNAARQIGNIGAETVRTLLDDNHIAHGANTPT